MTDEKRIRLEIEITERMAQILARWQVPPELGGETLESKIWFLLDDCCSGIESAERTRESFQLHRQFNLRHPDDTDDFIPF